MFGMIKNLNSMTNTKGIGLGLCISNLIVKKFNGMIDFTSEINKGSNFFYTFEVNEISDDKLSKIKYNTYETEENEISFRNYNMNVDIQPSKLKAQSE